MIRFSGLFSGAGLVRLAVLLIAAVSWPVLAPGVGSASTAEPYLINAAIKTIALDNFPAKVVVDKNSKYAYVTNTGNGNLFVIDLKAASLHQSLPTGASYNWGIDITPDGNYVYTAEPIDDRLSKINTSTNTVSSVISVTGFPRDLVISPSGSYIYVSDYSNNYVRVVDASTETVTLNISSGLSSPYGLDVTPNGAYLYVANYTNATVSKFDTATHTNQANFNVGTNPMEVVAGLNNNYVYSANYGSDAVSVINVATDAVDQTITVGSEPFELAISPDGKYLYVTCYAVSQVYMVSTETFTTVQTFDVGTNPRGVDVSPDGRYIVTANANRSVTIIDLNPTAAGGDDEETDPGKDTIPPGGTGNQLGGGGDNGGNPLPAGYTWQPGQGDSNHNLGLVVAHTGEQAGQPGQAVTREFVLPGILFEQTGPTGATEQCWVALNESGTMPSGVTYATEVGYNSGAMIAGFNTIWPQSLLQSMSTGSHHLVYCLVTSDGRKSNCRDEYLVLDGDTGTAAAISPVKATVTPLAATELTFKVQLAYFNETTGFVDRVKEGMCTVETEQGTWGTFPITDGLLTFTIPFGVTTEVGFTSQIFNGTKTVRMEFKDGYLYCYGQDHRDAVVEVYQCVDGESYALSTIRTWSTSATREKTRTGLSWVGCTENRGCSDSQKYVPLSVSGV